MDEKYTDSWQEYVGTAYPEPVDAERAAFLKKLDGDFIETMDRLWQDESARAVIRAAKKSTYVDIQKNEAFFKRYDLLKQKPNPTQEEQVALNTMDRIFESDVAKRSLILMKQMNEAMAPIKEDDYRLMATFGLETTYAAGTHTIFFNPYKSSTYVGEDGLRHEMTFDRALLHEFGHPTIQGKARDGMDEILKENLKPLLGPDQEYPYFIYLQSAKSINARDAIIYCTEAPVDMQTSGILAQKDGEVPRGYYTYTQEKSVLDPMWNVLAKYGVIDMTHKEGQPPLSGEPFECEIKNILPPGFNPTVPKVGLGK
ncbi:MAG: hypothetical protein U1E36_02990 [Rickettsiales bacterium]